MVCPKCGAVSKEGYCLRCGTLVSGTVPTKIPSALLVERNSIKDIDDLEIYIGVKALKLTQVPINFAALFLGPIWLGYRKAYVLATLLVLLDFLFIGLLETFFQLPILIYIAVYSLFYFSFANSLYVFSARLKIHRLKRKYIDYFENLVKKGGTSYLGGFFVLLVTAICIAGFMIWF